MNYINAEQFQEQPIKVQEVLLKWWQPSIGDLFVWVKRKGEFENDLREMECCNSKNIVQMTSSFKGINEGGRIPLLTEGQLREFIEEKVGEIIGIGLYCGGYSIVTAYRKHEYENLGDNLLQAYWKVACQIAEEATNE